MAKRILSFMLVVLMLVISVPLCYAADFETGTYRVISSDGVKVYSEASSTSSVSVVARRDACLTVLKTENGYGYVVFDSIYGWIDLTSGLSFVRSDPYADSQGKVEGLVDIEISQEPAKKTYIDGEEKADITGLKVLAVFSDGTKYPVAKDYSVAFPSLKNPGKKVVTVYYAGFTATFFVTVERIPIKNIEITSLPLKTVYKQGEEISFDGLQVVAHFDGREDKVLTDYEMTEIVTDGTAPVGEYKITVKYKYDDIVTDFKITVEQTSLQSLIIKTLPQKLTVYQGEELDFADTVLEAQYDNGIVTQLKYGDFKAEYDNTKVGVNTAKLFFEGKYAAFDFTVLALESVGIEIIPPKHSKSVVGKEPNFSDLQVFAVFNSGLKKTLKNTEYIIESNIDTSVAGSYKVTVRYGEYSQVFEFTVVDRIFGDVNFNGKIDTNDAKLILRYSAKLGELDDDQIFLGDVNSDGKVNTKDAKVILRVVAKLDVITRAE